MQITITGRGIELTDAIKAYVAKKLGGLDKFFDGIVRAGVVVGMETHHHQKGDIFLAECKLEIPGRDIFIKEMAASEYAAVDLLKERLEKDLKKHKEKLRQDDSKNKETARQVKEYDPDENDKI